MLFLKTLSFVENQQFSERQFFPLVWLQKLGKFLNIFFLCWYIILFKYFYVQDFLNVPFLFMSFEENTFLKGGLKWNFWLWYWTLLCGIVLIHLTAFSTFIYFWQEADVISSGHPSRKAASNSWKYWKNSNHGEINSLFLII